VFGIPQILSSKCSCFKGVQFLYLLDEYENLLEEQQRYVNTLIREKELPCSFKIGGRIYGFKTFRTYSDEEDIKEGSEYEVLPLDSRLRDHRQYKLFAERLCARRLIESGYAPANSADPDLLRPMLYQAFEMTEPTLLMTAETAFVSEKYKGRERPYFSKLRSRLREGAEESAIAGVQGESDIDSVIQALSCPHHPILEKVNIFRLYQILRTSTNLQADALDIASQCDAFLKGDHTSDYSALVEKRKSDLSAQLLRECDQKQRYLGFETFIEMSEGLPRNLLVILKSIFKWSIFNEERPFAGGTMSVTAQREGVREAAEWFFDDARMPGDDGAAIRAGVSKLATLFREVRFSDKPSEKSICTFSADLSQCSLETRRIVNLAEKWSLLIAVSGGQRDRNTMRVDEKYYINAMLAPKWDLPVSRGGALELSPDDMNAIFDPLHAGSFDQMLRTRVDRMMAPFFGVRKRGGNGMSSQQSSLPLDGTDA